MTRTPCSPAASTLEADLRTEGGALAAALPGDLRDALVESALQCCDTLASVLQPQAIAELEAQLYQEGSALALALPMELRDSIVRRTVEGDSVLAAAMRLKFFGELDLLSTPAAVSSSTVATHAPAMLAASSQASISKRDMSTFLPGNSPESSAVSDLMHEVEDLLHNLPPGVARQLITSILEDESAVSAKLRERLVLLLLAANEEPSRPKSAKTCSPFRPQSANTPAVLSSVAVAQESAGEKSRETSQNSAADQGLAHAKKWLVAQLKPKLESGMETWGISWTQAAPVLDEIAIEVLSVCLETGDVAPIMQKMASDPHMGMNSRNLTADADVTIADRLQMPTPRSESQCENADEVLEFNVSRPQTGTSQVDRFSELLESSTSILQMLPGTPARSLLDAALEGKSLLAAALRERLYEEAHQPPATCERAYSETSERSREFSDDGYDESDPDSMATPGDELVRAPSHRKISPLLMGNVLPTPRSERGGTLSPLSELTFRSLELVRRLPDESAIALTATLLTSDSAMSAALRSRLHHIRNVPVRDSGNIFSVKHNLCTQDGLLATLGVVAEGSPDVEGVLLDQFGRLPKDANERSRIRLDDQQAHELTLRMQFAGKTFVVEPYTWQRLDQCEDTVTFRTSIFRDGREDYISQNCYSGQVSSDSVTNGWAFHEFEVDVSWNSFELLAEAHSGFVILMQGERPSDDTYDFENEKQIKALRLEWAAKEIKVDEARKAKDDAVVFQLSKESSALYKKMKDMIDARPKAFYHVFPPRVHQLVHIPVISRKVSGVDLRAKAEVELPEALENSLFPGVWHVAFKCTADPRHPMAYKLGIRYTTRSHLQKDRLRRHTANQEDSDAEREKKRREAESAAIKNSDMRALERIKWEKWNKVGLAKALMVKHAENFYPPKSHEMTPEIQKLVRGFLARQRLKWLQEVDLRRIQLKEKELKMKDDLSYEDKLLIRAARDKKVPQELDDLRFAQSAATMLRYGDLQNPYKLAQAARAVFNVMDEDGSGYMDTGELREALSMLGIDNIKDEDLHVVVNHFDEDQSGTIDREEFKNIVQTLCVGGKDVMKNLKEVLRLHTSKLIIKKKPPPAHEPTPMDPTTMTRAQLENALNGLKMRLTNRNQSDKAKKGKEEREAAAAEEARKAAEADKLERELKHAEEMRLRQHKEAADQASANEVLESAMFKVSIALYVLLGEEDVNAGGDQLNNRVAEIFKTVNAANNGEVSFDEMKHAVIDTDVFVPEEMLQITLQTFDLDQNQALNASEFSDMCSQLLTIRAKMQKGHKDGR